MIRERVIESTSTTVLSKAKTAVEKARRGPKKPA
jgi:hypothetical protein